jgi:hypothetical protein
MRMQILEFLQQPRSGLRLVSVLRPLGEQREVVGGPIGPARWHGRWIAFVRRKGSKHFASIVRIRHEGVIIQLYAVRLHVRNIDSAKQWPDITRERNLWRLFMFALLFYHMFSSICIVAALAMLAQRTSLGATANVWNFLAEGCG